MVGARGSITRAFGLVAGANSLVTEPASLGANSSRFGGCDTNFFWFFLRKFYVTLNP